MPGKIRTSFLLLVAAFSASITLCITSTAGAQSTHLAPPHLGMRGRSVPAVQEPARAGDVPAVQNPNTSIGNFGLIDFPGSTGSVAIGINDKGQIVGGYDGSDVLSNPAHSFVLKGSTFKTINYPNAISTEANAINDEGTVVGYYTDASNNVHGFKFSGSTYTAIDHPGAVQPVGTVVWGINNLGEIVGGYSNGTTVSGFLLSNGSYSDIYFPGSTYTAALGINKAGQIVGWYGDSSGNVNGFLYDHGSYTTLDYPGFPEGYAEGINDNGQIVGGYGNFGTLAWQHGFLYQNGQFTSIDAPFGPAVITLPGTINNHGNITGTYQDATGTWYGFVATVTK